jgi:hypothetical protein
MMNWHNWLLLQAFHLFICYIAGHMLILNFKMLDALVSKISKSMKTYGSLMLFVWYGKEFKEWLQQKANNNE